MAYELVKRVSRTVGAYRAARWFHRHVMDRRGLDEFRRERDFLRQFINPGDLCFDVGANIGAKTEMLLGLGARVVAFEPQEECRRELIARIGPRPVLTTVAAAMGPTPGKGTFFRRDRNTTSGMVREWEGNVEGAMTVDVTTLDACIVKYGAPKYCKVDVEGYEIEVFAGLSRPIDVISFEFHLRDGGAESMFACLERLSQLGDYGVNLTLADAPSFVRPGWLDVTEFKAAFPTMTAMKPGEDWGDIFLKRR